jgi:hypothetical protein
MFTESGISAVPNSLQSLATLLSLQVVLDSNGKRSAQDMALIGLRQCLRVTRLCIVAADGIAIRKFLSASPEAFEMTINADGRNHKINSAISLIFQFLQKKNSSSSSIDPRLVRRMHIPITTLHPIHRVLTTPTTRQRRQNSRRQHLARSRTCTTDWFFERNKVSLTGKVVAGVEPGLLAQPLLQQNVPARLAGRVRVFT